MMAVMLVLPAASRAADADTYIVQLTADPLATYDGGTKGIPGTSPDVTGRKLKADSAPGLDYRAFLAARQQAALDRVPGARVVHSYRYAFAGFAAELTSDEAQTLEKAPGVVSVQRSELEHVMEDEDPDARLGGPFGEGPAYLRLTAPDEGLWAKLGGPLLASGAGAGVIVGDIDTGIEPGHPSFADAPAGDYVGDPYAAPAVWDGACVAGDGFPVTACNHKLIGARYYVDGFGRANLAPGSFTSPRDDDGHGTHTASIAAGNYGVKPKIGNNDFGVDIIAGIAPRAYVAAYKVCWNGNGTTRATGCDSADVVKAIDQAVADGVDVINMSVGNNTSAVYGPQEAALLNAAVAGVFVANSAGNAGPAASTVGSPSSVPWTTSVAATTLHRAFNSSVTVSRPGDPDFTVTGASVTDGVAGPLVDAASAALPPATSATAALCKAGTLDPALVSGKVVLCLRGDNDRVDKSHQVALAGGAGMILYNATAAQELDTDTHWVPSAHVTKADGERIKAAIAAGDATVTLTAGHVDATQPDRVLAAFSSRGPQTASPDIPKPDIAAPGVQILAGAASEPSPITGLQPGNLFQSIQGTSMASPQVAGAGALLTQDKPTLSPAEIKSELMMTAKPAFEEDGRTTATPFEVGSGQLDPNAAAAAGLVLDTTVDDYVQYLEFMDPSIVVGDIPKKRPNDLNLPAIAFSRFVGKDATTRTFRSVDATLNRWNVSVEAPPGTTATTNVGSFRIAAGQKQPVTVTLTRTTAAMNVYTFGALVLTNADGRTLRLPISVRPAFATVTTPVTVSTADAAGAQALTVKPGWGGALTGLGFGLAAPTVNAGQRITRTTGRLDLSGADPGTQLFPVTVPSGAQFISARLSNVDAGTDLDLFLFRDPNGDGNYSDAVLASSSTRTDAAEQINLAFPVAGKYVLAVLAFTTPSGGASYDLSNWIVNDPTPDDPSGGPGLVVGGDPVTVTPGDPATLRLRWSDVAAKGVYLGVVIYQSSTTPGSAISLVELTKTVDEPSPTPTPTATPTPTETATPSDPPVTLPDPGPPVATPTAVAPPKPTLRPSVRVAKVSGRTLTLRLANARGAVVRASVKLGDRFVATTTGRRVPAGGTLKLRLNRPLKRGHYTVKVFAQLKGHQTVVRVALRRP
jgi:subtilisin family serine protease